MFMVSSAVPVLLRGVRSHLFLFFFHLFIFVLFFIILRGRSKKTLLHFVSRVCSAFSLKGVILSVLLFRSLMFWSLFLCILLGNILISFSWPFLKKPAHCSSQWLLLIHLFTNSVGGFPFPHTFSSIYCLSAFGQRSLGNIWGNTSL